MNIQTYITSGVLEMYAMDQLDQNGREEVERMIAVFPAIKAELDSIYYALEMYSAAHGVTPHPRVKKKIQDVISDIEREKKMDLNNIPLISNFSDHERWYGLIKELIPQEVPEDEPYIKVLKNEDNILQMLVVSSTDFEDEVHEDLNESFLILKGRCKCTVGTDVRFMEAGEFMAIPLHENHTVEVTSKHVVAILQRVSI